MNILIKKTGFAILAFLCVWLFLQLTTCKRRVISVLYKVDTLPHWRDEALLESALVEDTQPDQQEDVLVPLSVNYSGPPIYALYNRGYDINPKVCSGTKIAPQLLVVIHSASFNVDQRTAVRYTWKHFERLNDVAMTFFIGSSENKTIMENVRAESEFYGDIVVSRVSDTYENLTLKTISMCEWVHKFCPRANFVLKADDDIFLNVPRLLEFIKNQNRSLATRSVYGKVNHATGPVRYPGHKFNIPEEEYPGNVYPDYMQGASYLFTGDIAGPLYRTALKMDFFRMEDVFLTGFVSERIRAARVNVDTFYRVYYEIWEYKTIGDVTIHVTSPCEVKKMICIHYAYYEDIFTLWYHLFDRQTPCK